MSASQSGQGHKRNMQLFFVPIAALMYNPWGEIKIRKSDSFIRRSDEQLLIKALPVINYVKKPRSKRSRLMREEVNIGTNLACDECGTDYGGFECNQNTVHLECHACGNMMPSRTDIVVPQHCEWSTYSLTQLLRLITCDNFDPFDTNWQAWGVTDHFVVLIGNPGRIQEIGERTIIRIPYLAHEWNWQEQYVTERCIERMGKTLQDVVSEWVEKLDNQDIDLTRMPLNHAEMITSETHVCNDCYDKLVSYFLYWFRICLPKDHLPPDAAEREDCWYGYACRTQKHNEDHARKRNHVCRPTKGSIEY
ncbi:uncharacterized protein LOC143576259 [Bidens hawaiensis]|uniref:uncharacterized protein LOC143576259 n=1 Tax=Bidens hawaiensis TaxID=980011 RepID=UPI004049450F